MSNPISNQNINRYFEALQNLKEQKDIFFDRAKEVAKRILKFFRYTDTKDYFIILNNHNIKNWIEDENSLVNYHVEECSRNDVFWEQYLKTGKNYLNVDTRLNKNFDYLHYFPSTFLFIADEEIMKTLEKQQKEKNERVSKRRKSLAEKKK
jgi:hypothetical protein